MPKFRDLGINAIPSTMRPPEMGAGGGPNTTECGGQTATCKPDQDTTECASNSATCKPDDETTECRGAATCKDDDVTPATQCKDGQFTCDDKLSTSGRGFSAADVAQLRQQLEGRIGDSLEI